MFSKVPYHIVDLTVKILTLNLYIIKRLITPYTNVGSVLDLGCGVGSLAPLFKKNNYLGIDIDKSSIEYAWRKNPGYNFRVSDVTKFKSSKRFDLVLIIGVLHHISDKDVQRTLRCILKFLKRDGRLVIIEAIPPLYKWNLPGYFLRAYDNGKFIRETKGYKILIEKSLELKFANPFLDFF